MTPPVTHNEVMDRLCGICMGKVSLRKMSEAAYKTIRKYLWAGYTKGESPNKLCNSCNTWLLDVDKSGSIEAAKRKPPLTFNKLRDLAPPRQTRGSASGSSQCQCGYCQVGHLSGQRYLNKMKELGNRKVPGPVPAPPDTSPKSIHLCVFCHGILAKGVSHVCGRRAR